MDSFYIIVLSVAVVFLILILTYVGILMNRKNLAAYPPVSSACPDNWVSDGSNCTIPSGVDGSNIGNIYADSNTFAGSFQANTPGLDLSKKVISFSDAAWSAGNYAGLTPVCAQKKWATQFNLSWDGVSNYTSC